MGLAFLQLHLSILLAGWTGIFGKLLTLSPGLIVFWRIVIAGSLLWAWLSYKKQIKRIPLKTKLIIAAVGAFLMIQWSLFYTSIKLSNVSITVVAFSSMGFFTAIFEPLWNRKSIVLQEIGFSILTILGIVLIFHFDAQFQLGIVFGVLSAAGAALLAVWYKRLLTIVDANTLMAWQLLGAFVALSLIMPFYRHFMPSEPFFPLWPDTGYLLIFGTFCTLGMYLLQIASMKHISAFTVNLSYNLEPIYSIILAMILFNEGDVLGWSFYVGLALIGLSVFLQSFSVVKASRRLTKLKNDRKL